MDNQEGTKPKFEREEVMLIPGSYHFKDETELSELNERLTNPWMVNDSLEYNSDAQTLKIGLQVEGKLKLKKVQLCGVRLVYCVPLHRAIILVKNVVSYDVVDDEYNFLEGGIEAEVKYHDGFEASYSEDENKLSFRTIWVTLSCVVESLDCKLKIEEAPNDYFERRLLFLLLETDNFNPLDCP